MSKRGQKKVIQQIAQEIPELISYLLNIFDFPEIATILLQYLDPKCLGRCVQVSKQWNSCIIKLWEERDFCFISYQKTLKTREITSLHQQLQALKQQQTHMNFKHTQNQRDIIVKYQVKKDPNQPKRPSTAYLFYCADKRAALKATHPELTPTMVQRRLGADWKAMSQKQKKPWTTKQDNAKAAYEKENTAYLKSLPKEQTKAYLDLQKGKAIKNLQDEFNKKYDAEDFPNRTKNINDSITKVKLEIVCIEKESTAKAIEFFNNTRISPHVLSLITPYMPSHPNSKKLLVTSSEDKRAKILEETRAKLLAIVQKQEELRKLQQARVQQQKTNTGLKFAVGERVNVLFTVDGKDDYYEGKVQKITNQRKKLYTVVFDKNEKYTDIKEEEMKPLVEEASGEPAKEEPESSPLLDLLKSPLLAPPTLSPTLARTVSSFSIPTPSEYHKKYESLIAAVMDKDGDDNVIFLEPGRVQIDESAFYEDDENDVELGIKLKKNISIIGLGPERSNLVSMEDDFESLFGFIEEGALCEVFEGVTARFENIRINLSECKGQKTIATFGLQKGSTVHFINCEFINCTFSSCLPTRLAEVADGGSCKIFVKNCIFTDQAFSTFEMDAEGNEIIIENSLFCNNGLQIENEQFYGFRDISSLITVHEREKNQKIQIVNGVATHVVEKEEQTSAPRLHSVSLIGCRFISNRGHLVHFDENIDTPLGWMERLMGSKKQKSKGPALTRKKNEHLKLKFENNWTFDNMCAYCSAGHVCPEQLFEKDEESTDSSVSERGKFFRLMQTMTHGGPFAHHHHDAYSDSSDDSSIHFGRWMGGFGGGIRLGEDSGESEDSDSY
jgi:hypothetical protein